MSAEFLELLNHPVISERYFFPRPGSPVQPLELQGADGVKLVCSEKRVANATKTLVHYHGNGEIVADYDDGYLDSLAALGVNVIMVEYRGYGASGGQTQLGKMLEDVRCVREHLGLSSEQTIVYGRSVGAIFAVEWAKLDPTIGGLILESGVADPYQRLAIRLRAEELGTDDETLKKACSEYLDHARKLSQYHGRLLVLHAAQDTLVGLEHAKLHMEVCPTKDKELVLFPRGGHNTILGATWNAYLSKLGEFLGG